MTIKPVLVPDHDAATLRRLMDQFATAATGPSRQQLTESRSAVAAAQKKLSEGSEQQLNIQQLATISDEALDNAYHYGRSTPGNTFGWQANLKSAAYAKQMIDQGVTDIEAISDAIHKGWNVTARAFVQNPEQFADTEKLQAAGKLEAKLQQRAKLMNIGYSQLPDDEQEKDRVVARALLQALKGPQGVAEGLYKDTSGTFMDRVVGEIMNYRSLNNANPKFADLSSAVKSKLKSLGEIKAKQIYQQALKQAAELSGQQGVAEGKPQKRADRYHINKDGKPASLASYADRESAVKDRDARYPDAKVHQVGPRGKVKGEFEEGMAESRSAVAAAARDYETALLNKDNERKQTWLQKTIDFANKTGFQIKTNPSRTKAIFINKQLGFGLQAMVKNYARGGDGLTVRYGDLDGKDNFDTDLAPDEFHDTFVRLYKDAKAGRVDQGHKFPTQNQFDPEEPEQKYLRSFLEQDVTEATGDTSFDSMMGNIVKGARYKGAKADQRADAAYGGMMNNITKNAADVAKPSADSKFEQVYSAVERILLSNNVHWDIDDDISDALKKLKIKASDALMQKLERELINRVSDALQYYDDGDLAESGVTEAGRPDVMRHRGDTTIRVVKRGGKPIGEIGIDSEASEGNGSYYVKLYDGSYDAVGFDTAAEALAELRAAISEGITETTGVKYGVFAKGGSVGSQRFRDDPLKTFDTKEEATADARRRRSGLSKGERGYYRMGYVVKPIKGVTEDDVDEGLKQKLAGAALAGAMALGAGGAQAQSTDRFDPAWGTSGYNTSIRSDVSSNKSMNTADPSKDTNDFQKRIQSVTGPNAKGEYKVVVMQGHDIVSHYVTKTPPPEWLYKEDAESKTDEGVIDNIKNTVRAANYDRLARRSNSQAVAGGGLAPPAQFRALSAKGDQRAQKAQDIRKGDVAESVDPIEQLRADIRRFAQ